MVVELVIEHDEGGQTSNPVLQHFPTTVVPRVGERIWFKDVQYEVTELAHFLYNGPARQTVRAKVKRAA